MKRIALGLCVAVVFSLAPTFVQAQATCLSPLAQIISPTPGSTLPAGAVTFQWCNASADYFLTIESLPGAHNIFFAFVNVTSVTLGPACNIPTATSPIIQCIPDLGETIYVTLWTQTGSGKTSFQAAPTVTYTAPNATPTPMATTTSVVSPSATFSSSAQSITLTATVAAASTVNQGTVTFQVLNGATNVGAAVTSATLANGSASVAYLLPTGTASGSYTIQASYSGGVSFLASSGNGTLTVTPAPPPTQTPDVDVFMPIVLSAAGLNGSFFTSEMTLTNRGTGNGTVKFTYTSSIGKGSGEATDTLAAGRQRIVPDAIAYLRSLGIPIPSSGNQGGTLLVTFSDLSSSSDGGVTVRTTTVVPEGRAGLAYAGIPTTTALTGPSYICGLRQNQADRSNVAFQNVGSLLDGNITLRVTVFSGDGGVASFHVLPDQVLPPGGFVQISGILISNGLSLSNGFVRVEQISGKSPYYAYGVINDQANSDGSFIPPILENSLLGKTRLTLPVVVEANDFSTELVVTNWSSIKKTLNCRYVSDAIQAPNATANFTIDINPSQQLIWPDIVQRLRVSQTAGIGPKGPVLAGALFAAINNGDLSGISLAARTSAPGGGGRYGLFYTALPEGTASTSVAWLYGLQQNAENRTNLALVNTGETDINPDTFRVELFDGDTGSKVSTIEGIEVNVNRWYQFGKILSQYAPATSQGYARITRTAGSNPFIAYAVINDGANPIERSGDGAFIASAP